MTAAWLSQHASVVPPLASQSALHLAVSLLLLLLLLLCCGDSSQASRDEFLQLMAGNRLLLGMCPAAHCYCGYQFGYFAGQLGDGAAMYLGEVREGEEGGSSNALQGTALQQHRHKHSCSIRNNGHQSGLEA
jgi:uncharacterized protein YdiU (UPF0061 family)